MSEKTHIHWSLERRKVSQLIEWGKNPRTLTEKGIADLKKSIDKFGCAQPIIINIDDVICGGHGRKKVLEELKIEEVDCYVPSRQLSDKEFEELNIRLNKNIAGEFNYEILANEFNTSELMDWGFQVSDFTGFNIEEKKPEEDDAPALKEASFVKRGDLWQIGNHYLLCGDSTKIDDMKKLMNGQKADITFTSPPYNVGKTPNGDSQKYLNDSDDRNGAEYHNLLYDFTINCLLFSDYVFVNIQSVAANKITIIEYLYSMRNKYADVIIWDKKNAEPAMARRVLNSRFEYIHIFSNEAKRSIGNRDFRGTLENIFELSSRQGKEYAKIHKATFPVALPEHFIKNFSEGSILDPFGGTGSTLIACEQLERKAYLMELDEKYCQVILERYINFKKSSENVNLIDGETMVNYQDLKKSREGV